MPLALPLADLRLLRPLLVLRLRLLRGLAALSDWRLRLAPERRAAAVPLRFAAAPLDGRFLGLFRAAVFRAPCSSS
jgi:hypothetical protein